MSRVAKTLIGLSGMLLATAPGANSHADQQREVPPDLPIIFQTDRSGTSDIYAMDAAGRRQEPVIAGASNDEDPDWSPDGEGFAFSSDRDGSWQVYFARTAGGEPTQLTEGRFSSVDPVFSPDGKRIAFETNSTGDWEIFVMNADGSRPLNLSRSRAQDLDPAWSADSRRVVWSRVRQPGADLYAATVAARRPVRLTATRAAELEPAVSPNDGRIAFVRFERGYDLYLGDRNARKATPLTRGPAAESDPAFSPDGRTIAYTASSRGRDLELYAIPAEGGRPRNLSRNHVGNDSEADWRKPPRRGQLAEASTAAVPASHGPPFVCGAISSNETWGIWQVLNGAAGIDRLCGTAAKEWLRGFGGIDKLAGGQNGDRLEGGALGDLFKAHDGERDTLYGGQLVLNAAHAITGHSDTSLLDVAYVDKTLDLYAPLARYGINKVNP